MAKMTLAVAVVFLSGCAATGEWRALNIDGSSESAFNASLARMNDELSYARGRMFVLALADIANTRAKAAGAADDGRPVDIDDNLRRDLDGLNYEAVIALADRSGPPIKQQYHSQFWAQSKREAERQLISGEYRRSSIPSPPLFRDTNSGYVWPNN